MSVSNKFDEALREKAKLSLQKRDVEACPRLDAQHSTVLDFALVQVILHSRVTLVERDSVAVHSKKDGRDTVIPCGMTVWTGGTSARPLTEQLRASLGEEQLDAKAGGKIRVDHFMRVCLLDITTCPYIKPTMPETRGV